MRRGAPSHRCCADRAPRSHVWTGRDRPHTDSGDYSYLLRLGALLALCDLELDPLAVLEQLVAVHLDRGEVDEHVLPPVDRDEAVALLAVEPLHGALCHGALPHFDGAGSADPRPHLEAGAAAPFRCLPGLRRHTATEHARYTRRPRPAPPQIGQSITQPAQPW